jgi:hypothetical protein
MCYLARKQKTQCSRQTKGILMMLTQHATVRSQQRGIPPMMIDLLLQFGTRARAPGGVEKVYFDKSSHKQIKTYAGPLAGLLTQHLSIYAMVGAGERVVTIGHLIERVKRR